MNYGLPWFTSRIHIDKNIIKIIFTAHTVFEYLNACGQTYGWKYSNQTEKMCICEIQLRICIICINSIIQSLIQMITLEWVLYLQYLSTPYGWFNFMKLLFNGVFHTRHFLECSILSLHVEFKIELQTGASGDCASKLNYIFRALSKHFIDALKFIFQFGLNTQCRKIRKKCNMCCKFQ